MADPFDVRMRFTAQLQHLSASTAAAQKAAAFALKNREMDEDLHSCILEQIERNSMNNRANIMYFIEHLCAAAQRESHPEYIRMMQRDILRVIDAVCPPDGSGAANIRGARRVLEALQKLNVLEPQTVAELDAVLKSREISTHPFVDDANGDGGAGGENGAGGTDASAAERARSGGRLDKRQIEQRIEEDRERHKRQREGIWQVDEGADGDGELRKMWEEVSDLGEDDYLNAREEAAERRRVVEFGEPGAAGVERNGKMQGNKNGVVFSSEVDRGMLESKAIQMSPITPLRGSSLEGDTSSGTGNRRSNDRSSTPSRADSIIAETKCTLKRFLDLGLTPPSPLPGESARGFDASMLGRPKGRPYGSKHLHSSSHGQNGTTYWSRWRNPLPMDVSDCSDIIPSIKDKSTGPAAPPSTSSDLDYLDHLEDCFQEDKQEIERLTTEGEALTLREKAVERHICVRRISNTRKEIQLEVLRKRTTNSVYDKATRLVDEIGSFLRMEMVGGMLLMGALDVGDALAHDDGLDAEFREHMMDLCALKKELGMQDALEQMEERKAFVKVLEEDLRAESRLKKTCSFEADALRMERLWKAIAEEVERVGGRRGTGVWGGDEWRGGLWGDGRESLGDKGKHRSEIGWENGWTRWQ